MLETEKAKPILLNTDTISAILDGRKTEMRKYIPVSKVYDKFFKLHENINGEITGRKNTLYAGFYNDNQIFERNGERIIDAIYYKAPYKVGDILYVKETFCYGNIDSGENPDGSDALYISQYEDEHKIITKEYALKHGIGIENIVWKSAVHMTKNDARIFLKIKNVRVERLQNMPHDAPMKEGIYCYKCPSGYTWKPKRGSMFGGHIDTRFIYTNPMSAMRALWDLDIKCNIFESEWDANPWVFVYEFEVL